MWIPAIIGAFVVVVALYGAYRFRHYPRPLSPKSFREFYLFLSAVIAVEQREGGGSGFATTFGVAGGVRFSKEDDGTQQVHISLFPFPSHPGRINSHDLCSRFACFSAAMFGETQVELSPSDTNTGPYHLTFRLQPRAFQLQEFGAAYERYLRCYRQIPIQYQDLKEALCAEDYDKAVFLLTQTPKAGVPGEGAVWQSLGPETLRKMQQAAKQGSPAAQFCMGIGCAYGVGNVRDSVRWFRKAAEQGLAAAQYHLGEAYADGLGVAQDHAQAFRWWQKAADQGNAWAQHNLGSLYADGHGVTQDYEKAFQWYQKAADQGMAEAQSVVGFIYVNGRGVAQDDAQAARWWQKAADQGFAEAQYNLGSLYLTGRGVTQDDAQAAKWYQKAADQGMAEAQRALGDQYADGKGVRKNPSTALEWYGRAGKTFLADGRREAALDCCNSMRAIDPESPLLRALAQDLRAQ